MNENDEKIIRLMNDLNSLYQLQKTLSTRTANDFDANRLYKITWSKISLIEEEIIKLNNNE